MQVVITANTPEQSCFPSTVLMCPLGYFYLILWQRHHYCTHSADGETEGQKEIITCSKSHTLPGQRSTGLAVHDIYCLGFMDAHTPLSTPELAVCVVYLLFDLFFPFPLLQTASVLDVRYASAS
jgi:hypothetical protein